MYKNQFDSLLQKNTFSNSMLLFGQSHFLMDLYLKRLQSKIQADEVHFYYGFEYDFSKLKSVLSQSSIFGDKILVILKSENKINGKELKNLIALTEKDKSMFFIYLFYGDDFKTQLNAFGDSKSVRFFEPNEQEIRTFILIEAKKSNIIFDENSLSLFIEMSKNNLSLLNSELKKLKQILGNTKIDTKTLLNYVSIPASFGIDLGINELLLTGNLTTFIQKYQEQNWEEIAIVSYMLKFIEEIFLFRSALELRENTSSSQVLGRRLPPQVEREKIAIAKKFNLNSISKILFTLSKLEVSLKSGNIGDKSSLFISMILKLNF